MNRHAIKRLEHWKDAKGRKPMIIRGAKASWKNMADERIRKDAKFARRLHMSILRIVTERKQSSKWILILHV